ncbi:MAG: PilZ domain-containing protein [Candidatus Omnitrophota bacterium]|nr:PilZ domain-containing protein [Candidatus Omnitrophota bacterium]
MVTRRILDFLSGRKKRAREITECRRKNPRLRCFNLIKFTFSDGTKYETISNILNISETGLRFTCYEPLPANSILKMVIHLREKNIQVPIEARLVWIRKKKGMRGVFVAGVNFLNIDDKSRQQIRDMINESRPQKSK